MVGNAPNGYCHRDRDRNVHQNRQEQPRIPFPKFPEFDGGSSWKSFIASLGKVCVHYDFGEQDMVEFGESLSEVRSGQRKNTEALDDVRSGQRKNTEALDEIRSTLHQLVPDSKSALTNVQ